MLAPELLLGLLETRSPEQPVPVRIPAPAWDTSHPLSDWLVHHLVTAYVATTAWTDNHPDAVPAFQRALHKVAKDLTEALGAREDLAVRHLYIAPDTATRMDFPVYPTSGPSVSQLQRVQNLMHRSASSPSDTGSRGWSWPTATDPEAWPHRAIDHQETSRSSRFHKQPSLLTCGK
ncbi:hypothetical protein LCL61_29305 [Amycolatopsis coloradensis]|uniref:Uncharacterized protein n=1 Tax=Amycolatopsis coloradensis TaxID=76021 RepID=A0ACD5BJU6_9PSEU